MKIHFLKEDALIALKANVDANLGNYRKPTNEWIYDYFQGEDPFMEANFECEDFQLLISPKIDDISSTDVQNVRILYSALKNLTETQATDERLWAGLCHYDLWDYLSKRWKMEEDKITSQLVLSRYFISNAFGRKRGLTVNTLSKLWWIGRLTYDQNRSDPFELLKYFETEFSTKLLLMLSNNFMSNFEITSGLLEALMYLESIGYELKQKQNPRSSGKKETYLKATAYLNVFGGTHILDYFTKDEIKSKIIEYMLSLPHTYQDSIAVQEHYAKDKEKPEKSALHYPSIQTIVLDVPKTEPFQEAELQDETRDDIRSNPSIQQSQVDESAMEHNHRTDSTLTLEEPMPKAVSQMSFDDMLSGSTTDSARFGKIHSTTQMDDELVAYCEDMRMSYSYKAVLLLALLENVEADGKIAISEAVPFFRKFYRSRIEKGLPAELKSSIYSDLNVDDARILANITRNPLNALLLSNYFEYDSVTQRFGFKAEVWSGITEVGRSRMADAANARLAKYYQDL